MPRKNVHLPNDRISTPLKVSTAPILMNTTKLTVTNRRPFSTAANMSYMLSLSSSTGNKSVGIAGNSEPNECFDYYYHTDQRVEEQRQLREQQLHQTPSLTSVRNSNCHNLSSSNATSPESAPAPRPPSRVRMMMSRFEGSSITLASSSSSRSCDDSINSSSSNPARSSSRPRSSVSDGSVTSTKRDCNSETSVASATSPAPVSVHISLVSQFLAKSRAKSVTTQLSTAETPPDSNPVTSSTAECEQTSAVAASAPRRTPSRVGDFMAKRKAATTPSLIEVVVPSTLVVGEQAMKGSNKPLTTAASTTAKSTSRVDTARMAAFLERAKRLTTLSAAANASVSAALSSTASSDPVPANEPAHTVPPVNISVPLLAARYLERASSRPRPHPKSIDKDPFRTNSVSEAVAVYARSQSQPNGRGGTCGSANPSPLRRPLSPFNSNCSQTSSVMSLRDAWERASSRPRAGASTVEVSLPPKNSDNHMHPSIAHADIGAGKAKDRNSHSFNATGSRVDRESTDLPARSSNEFDSCKENRLPPQSTLPRAGTGLRAQTNVIDTN